MLLASIVAAQHQDKQDSVGGSCEKVLLDTLEKNAGDRAEFESVQKAAEASLQQHIAALHEAVVEGNKTPGTIIDEIMSLTAPSPRLANLRSELRAVQQCISGPEAGLAPLLQSEQNRRKVEAAVWHAFGKTSRNLLPLTLLEMKQKCAAEQLACDNQMEATVDYLHKFNAVVPSVETKLQAFEDTCLEEWLAVREQQNPALIKPFKAKYEKVLSGLLKEMTTGTTKLSQRWQTEQTQLLRSRALTRPDAMEFQDAIQALKSHVAANTPDESSKYTDESTAPDLKELIAQLRTLLGNPVLLNQTQKLVYTPSKLNLDSIMDEAMPPSDEDRLLDNTDDGDSSMPPMMLEVTENDKSAVLRKEFEAELEANTKLSPDERAHLLDEFNEDMAALEASLALEREKHQEQLRSRLSIRQLKKNQADITLLHDQEMEETMLEKQELEMQELERAFEAEQAKIDEEFNLKMKEMQQVNSLAYLPNSRATLDTAVAQAQEQV